MKWKKKKGKEKNKKQRRGRGGGRGGGGGGRADRLRGPPALRPSLRPTSPPSPVFPRVRSYSRPLKFSSRDIPDSQGILYLCMCAPLPAERAPSQCRFCARARAKRNALFFFLQFSPGVSSAPITSRLFPSPSLPLPTTSETSVSARRAAVWITLAKIRENVGIGRRYRRELNPRENGSRGGGGGREGVGEVENYAMRRKRREI